MYSSALCGLRIETVDDDDAALMCLLPSLAHLVTGHPEATTTASRVSPASLSLTGLRSAIDCCVRRDASLSQRVSAGLILVCLFLFIVTLSTFSLRLRGSGRGGGQGGGRRGGGRRAGTTRGTGHRDRALPCLCRGGRHGGFQSLYERGRCRGRGGNGP